MKASERNAEIARAMSDWARQMFQTDVYKFVAGPVQVVTATPRPGDGGVTAANVARVARRLPTKAAALLQRSLSGKICERPAMKEWATARTGHRMRQEGQDGLLTGSEASLQKKADGSWVRIG